MRRIREDFWDVAPAFRDAAMAAAPLAPVKLAGIVKGIAKPGDYVVFLGAGNITQWAYALPGELSALEG